MTSLIELLQFVELDLVYAAGIYFCSFIYVYITAMMNKSFCPTVSNNLT